MITKPDNDDERHNGENQFLRADGYNTIIQAKNAVDADPQCTYKVSCADIMALAARDSVLLVMINNLSELYCAILLDQNLNLISWPLCVAEWWPDMESGAWKVRRTGGKS